VGIATANYSAVSFGGFDPYGGAGPKHVGRETMHTGSKIRSDIVCNKSPEVRPKDIASKHVSESGPILKGNMRGAGRKRATGVTSVTKMRKKAKRARVI